MFALLKINRDGLAGGELRVPPDRELRRTLALTGGTRGKSKWPAWSVFTDMWS